MMGEFIRSEKHFCGCIDAVLAHFVYKMGNGDIIRMCPICEKMTIIGRWK